MADMVGLDAALSARDSRHVAAACGGLGDWGLDVPRIVQVLHRRKDWLELGWWVRRWLAEHKPGEPGTFEAWEYVCMQVLGDLISAIYRGRIPAVLREWHHERASGPSSSE